MINFAPVYEMHMNVVRRGVDNPAINSVYVRKDLLEEYDEIDTLVRYIESIL